MRVRECTDGGEVDRRRDKEEKEKRRWMKKRKCI